MFFFFCLKKKEETQTVEGSKQFPVLIMRLANITLTVTDGGFQLLEPEFFMLRA